MNMENREIPKSPEVKSQELRSIVDSLAIEWEEVMKFNGWKYVIYPSDQDYPEEHGAWWSSNVTSGLGDRDIYVSINDPNLVRKRIFHEVLECDLMKQGLPVDEAHTLAQSEEEKIWGERDGSEKTSYNNE